MYNVYTRCSLVILILSGIAKVRNWGIVKYSWYFKKYFPVILHRPTEKRIKVCSPKEGGRIQPMTLPSLTWPYSNAASQDTYHTS